MRYARFIAAVFVGLIGSFFVEHAPITLNGIWLMLRALWSGKRATPEQVQRRTCFCNQCPIFYRPLGTCGTPLKDADLGCWCFMEMKSRLADATCWAKENKIQSCGWPDGL